MALSPEETTILEHMLIEDEGITQFPYMDCCSKRWRECGCKVKGKLTIGVGRNLDDVGISENEAMGLQGNDIKKVATMLERAFPWFWRLNTPRRVVVVAMTFNLGLDGLKKFKKMLTHMDSGDFLSASREMLNSQWSTQVKGRAIRLASIMEKGTF